MEIQSGYEILKDIYPKKNDNNQEYVNNNFKAILNDSMASTLKSDVGIGRAPMVGNMAEIQFRPLASSNENSVIERTEKLLDMLDNYREKLQDPEVSLDAIYPLVSEMDRKRENLTSTLNSLPDGDRLRDILSETMITSSLEVARFKRGDYKVVDW